MRKLAILLALPILLLSSQEAFGCVCGFEPNLTPEKDRANRLIAFERATAIFTGEVIFLDRQTVKLKVDKVWKGELAKEITMFRATYEHSDGTFSNSTCDYGFEEGAKYLIYAYGSVGQLRTHACSRTLLLKLAEKELRGVG